MGCCSSVPSGSVQVVERFGKFDRIAYPGFNCINCPCGESIAGYMSLRVQQLDVKCETKTKDNVFVTLVISVQYEVVKENLEDAFYKLTDSRTQITAYVFDVVRSTVPKINLDDVFTTKEEIATSVRQELTKSMASFGYQIMVALVTDIVPDQRVRNAMNEINAAQRLRMAAFQTAEANKISVVKAAEAEAEAKFLQGQGIARQRQAIVGGLRDSVKDFSSDVQGISSKDVIDLMLMTQYFDTMRDIGMHSSSSVFIPHSPANVADVASQIRMGFLQAQVPSNH